MSNVLMGVSLVGILSAGTVLGLNSLEKVKSTSRLQTATYFAPRVPNLEPEIMSCYTEDFEFISKRVDSSKYALMGALALGFVGTAIRPRPSRMREERYAVSELPYLDSI